MLAGRRYHRSAITSPIYFRGMDSIPCQARRQTISKQAVWGSLCIEQQVCVYVCVCVWGGGGWFSRTHWDAKFHFHGKFWINLINLGYHIYHKNSHILLFTLYFFTSPFYYLWIYVKLLLEEWQRVSDLGLHCLLRQVCSNTYSKYGNSIKSNSHKNHPGFAPVLSPAYVKMTMTG